VKRNGEFTVNIALVSEGLPVMGVILVPVSNLLYFASHATGAFKTVVKDKDQIKLDELMESSEQLPRKEVHRAFTVVGSRSHMSPETVSFIDNLKKTHPELDFVSVGSSLKLCLVAEGNADIYPRFGPTMEWDTAAGQAILEISGGKMTIAESGEMMRYNKRELLNPWFIASRH